MKSKYIQTSTTNDLETVGYIETSCETVAEFVEDIVRNERCYKFSFIRILTNIFGEKIPVAAAVLVIRNRNVVNDRGFEEIKHQSIESIEYRDGWGGVELTVKLKEEFCNFVKKG